jgi:hypothetical protein
MTKPSGEPAAVRLPLLRVASIWTLLAAVMLLTGVQSISEGQFPDPDDTLRMVQVRDLLAGQNWFDTAQYRIDPPGGVPMHWSRLVDVPLALVALVLQPFLGPAAAQMAAAVIVPLATLGCLLLLVGWIASRHFDTEVTGFAALCCGLVPVTLAQMQVLRIDHHGWQIVAVVAAVAALLQRNPVRGAWIAGLSLATALSISLEVLPFAAAFAGLYALRRLIDPAERSVLAHYMAALAGGSLLAFLVTRGPLALTPWCDAVAPAHIAFFTVVAAGCWLLVIPRALPRWALVAGLALAGAAGLAAFAAIAPACLTTPFGNLDPLVREYWYLNVTEGLPAWRQTPAKLASSLPAILLAFGALIRLYRTTEGAEQRWWRDYLLLFAATVVAGLLVWRSMAFAGALAAVPLGWLLSRTLSALREWRQRPGLRHAVAALAILAMGSAAALWLSNERAQASGSAPSGLSSSVRESRCALRRNAPLLDRFEPATIFAPLDIGPSLIERSRHAVVATGHHRAQAAMHDVIAAFMSREGDARATITAHGASLVVVCADLVEPAIYAADAPEGLMANLLAGDAPAWLEPADIGAPPPFKVWRVRR